MHEWSNWNCSERNLSDFTLCRTVYPITVCCTSKLYERDFVFYVFLIILGDLSIVGKTADDQG